MNVLTCATVAMQRDGPVAITHALFESLPKGGPGARANRILPGGDHRSAPLIAP